MNSLKCYFINIKIKVGLEITPLCCQKYLIENGADNRKGYSPLFMACLCGNENLETPLFMAGKSRNENLVKYLIEEGAAIVIKNTHGETALLIACRDRNEKKGTDIYEVIDVINSSEKELPFFFGNRKTWTYRKEGRNIPLEIYKNGFLTPNRLNFIIENCSDILCISSSLLKILIKNNEIQLLNIIFENFKFYDNDFIQRLLYYYRNKTSISVTDLNRIMSNHQYRIFSNYSVENFQDYFVSVCEYGNVNLIKYLIEHGADVNEKNESLEIPLCCACLEGNEKVAKYLIERGADIKVVDILGDSPLFMACKGGNENLVKYLIELGADINKESYSKDTPLFYACASGNDNLVKYLVEQGADITLEDFLGITALFVACEKGNEAIVKYLIEQGADINKENKWAETPLFVACEKGNEAIVNYLIEQGANINKVIDVINTPKRSYDLSGRGRLSTKENIIKYLVELEDTINKNKEYKRKKC
ncbi:ankyrin repeat-containing domain protein [Neocallimastix sp. 'constans']